ncbi:putative phage tail protein [Clostridium sp. Marseille-P2415]|uniref:putative phage tail protein n=1 Tax=Clostridium sp. Marseille-P2415 TaxID=1805471 RepID=UPI0013562D5F|nr:putative phage tail protein [Clostridium sp. Marseille-P2415]
MIREVDLLSYIPDFLKEYEEMKVIQLVVQPEIQLMEDETEVLFDNQYIKSSDIRSIRRYEKMLEMQPFADDTLADRRFKVLSRWNRMIPYTKITLRQKLAVLCGEDGYTLDINPKKVVTVRVALKSKRNLNEVREMLEEFVPCNMVIDLDLLYNQHSVLGKFTHKQLGAWSHRQIRNEVLISGE